MLTSDGTAPPDTSRTGLARRPLVSFFVIAFLGAWLVELPVILSETGTGLLPFTLPKPVIALAIAGATYTGPTLAAYIMARVTEGRAGPRNLLRRYVVWRVNIRWYLFVLLAIPAVELLGAIAVPGALASYQPLTSSMLLAYPLSLVITVFLGGPLGEEPGWRGFALPRLQLMHGPLVGSIILGVLWALWHFPLFWSGVWTPLTIPNMAMFLVMITFLTIIMTWVFNNAKGSLLITMLMHASFNTAGDKIVGPLFPAAVLDTYPLLPELIGFGVVALILIAVTRGQLSYQRYLQAQRPDLVAAPTG